MTAMHLTLHSSSANLGSQRTTWIDEHGVCFRLGPLLEPLDGRGLVETGYELVLLGRLHPMGSDDLEPGARALHERLRTLALDAIGEAAPEVTLVVLPLGRGTVSAGDRFAVGVELVLDASLAHPDKLPAPALTRRRIAELDGRLRSMGLPHWRGHATSRRWS
jgi:hypothetical protein